MSQEKTFTITINGEPRRLTSKANRTLLDALRELGHVDVKSGCEKGDCGACAVLLDGLAVDSCLMLAWQAEGRAVTTVAGIGGPDDPHPIQTAFVETGAPFLSNVEYGLELPEQGKIPVNPSGGLIACGHPVGATGIMQGVFAFWQLQGTIDKHFGDATLQVPAANRGAIHSHAGTGTYVAVSILEKAKEVQE